MYHYAFGVDLEGVKLNKKKDFLMSFPEDYKKYKEWLKECEYEEDENDEDAIDAYFEDYAADLPSYYEQGFLAYVAEKIYHTEGVELYVDDQKIYFLTSLPWEFNEKERNLSLEDFQAIFAKWLSRITDESWTAEEITLFAGDPIYD